MTNKSYNYKIILIISILVLALSFLVSLTVGSVSIPLSDSVKLIAGKIFGFSTDNISKSTSVILFSVRMPRVILSGLVGACLSVSGCVMQGILKNPLAEGGTLGVSSGASLGAVIAIFFSSALHVQGYAFTALFAMVFAFISILIVMAIAHLIDKSISTATLILTGVVFSMFASSIVSLIISLSGDQLRRIVFWSMGSFSGRGWQYVLLTLPFVIIGTVWILRYTWELDAFALGEQEARYIGVNVTRIKIELFIAVSLLIGISVSVSGVISFVGLIIPHIIRRLTGPSHLRLLVTSFFSGSAFLMLADLLSRTLLSPVELPVGVVTSLI
ncbi:MAG: iron ABC transporter permease, partial [Bacillota bacterium]|nr:iron ABC transporter permease [Bacillota bacterium]